MASTCLHYFQSDWIDFWNKGLCKQNWLLHHEDELIGCMCLTFLQCAFQMCDALPTRQVVSVLVLVMVFVLVTTCQAEHAGCIWHKTIPTAMWGENFIAFPTILFHQSTEPSKFGIIIYQTCWESVRVVSRSCLETQTSRQAKAPKVSAFFSCVI